MSPIEEAVSIFPFLPSILFFLLFLGPFLAVIMEDMAPALIFAGLIFVIMFFTVGISASFVAFSTGLSSYTAAQIILCSITYLSLGVVWSLFKWDRFMQSPDVQRALKSAKESLSRAKHLYGNTALIDSVYFPKVLTPSWNKSRICTWITFWPLSILVFLLSDFVSAIFDRSAKIYIYITKRHLP